MKKGTIVFLMAIVLASSWFAFGKKSQKTYQYTTVTCAAAPVISNQDWYKSDTKAPLFEGLDVLEFPVSTTSELAQRYFNQGLVLAYAFNHAEAARTFYYASKLDPDCAMAWWGFAYVLGPNYNAGMTEDNYRRAYDAAQKAVELSDNCTEKEKYLIRAMAERYLKNPPKDRRSLDIAYSKALQAAFIAFPNDANIGALYAESMLNLYPWNLYDKKGNPKEWTPEILSAIEKVLEINPKHPGAHHFYIHIIETSNEPEKGLNSARLFDEGLVPGAGHLVHMPAHIYIKTGDYHKGSLANLRAINVDSTYITSCSLQGAYPMIYIPHNFNFMSVTATLEGNYDWAIKAANKVSEDAFTQLKDYPQSGNFQYYCTIPYFVNVKFGKWEEILEMKNLAGTFIYPEAIRAYARGMAFLGVDEIENAKKELLKLGNYLNEPELDGNKVFKVNSLARLATISHKILKAEILASESEFEESIAVLKEAVDLRDELVFREPPSFYFSVRHNLGAVQVEAGKYTDALQTFEEDLQEFPKNGWALQGMKLAYSNLNDTGNAEQINERLKIAWATADVELSSARLK
jgi:tetratricopeptide (TPR) repeat protein